MTLWRDKLRKLIEDRGLNMKQLSRAAGLGETFVRDMLKNEDSNPRIDTLTAICDELGVSISEILEDAPSSSRKIPLIGYVSAGDGWNAVDGDGPFDHVELSLGRGEAVALRVRGDSMTPVFRDGDILIGTKRPTANPAKLLGADCIVETRSGERYIKVLKHGTVAGRFNLRSYNPQRPDIENVLLNWAAPIAMIMRERP